MSKFQLEGGGSPYLIESTLSILCTYILIIFRGVLLKGSGYICKVDNFVKNVLLPLKVEHCCRKKEKKRGKDCSGRVKTYLLEIDPNFQDAWFTEKH